MNVREATYQVLLKVFQEESLITEHYPFLFGKLKDDRDRRLAVELLYGTCRQKGRLEYVLQQFADRRKTEKKLWLLLLVGAYQLLYLSRTPDYAAINETVGIARHHFGSKRAGFVNAVLKRIAGSRERLSYPGEEDLEAYIRHNLSFPYWLGMRWISQYGRETAIEIMKAMNLHKPVVFRCFGNIESSVSSGTLRPAPYIRQAFETDLPIDVMRANQCYVMNESSQLVAELLRHYRGTYIVDAASSPGGKGLIVHSFNNAEAVIFNDVSPDRMDRILENARDLGRNILTPVASDMRRPAFRTESIDAVLLDAPCSGTGTLSGHPELKWIRNASDIQKRRAVQQDLLEKSFDLVKPGGVLVYAVCSMEREEGEDVVLDFVSRNHRARLISPFRFADPEVAEKFGRFTAAGPALRILPDNYLDGFYIAVVEKPA